MDATGKIFLGLDCDMALAIKVAQAVYEHPAIAGFKMNILADQAMYQDVDGVPLFEFLNDLGIDKWLDWKFHDTTLTVKNRVAIHAKRGMIQYMTVMVKGEMDMLQAAVQAAGSMSTIIGVTELTSLSEEQVHLMSGHPAKASVIQLARNAVLAGIKHLVCSPKELGVISERPELDVLTPIVPGIKLGDSVGEGQSRTGTPTEVLKACPRAKLVIASGIVKANNPVDALNRVVAEIEAVEVD